MRHGARREVRRLLKAVGLKVHRLCRVAVGDISISELTLDAGESVSLAQHHQRGLYKHCAARVPPTTAKMPRYDCESKRWVPALEYVCCACSKEAPERTDASAK